MKKLFLLLLVCTLFACKKKTAEIKLTDKNWVLTQATINPAIMVNGKAETDYMTKSGASACLNHNYTLVFLADGTSAIGSNGPLCDLLYSTSKTFWTLNNNEITFVNNKNTSVATLNGNQITSKQSYTDGGISYTITYIYTARNK